MANIPVQLYKGDSTYINTIPNANGQILLDEDTHSILVDDGTNREQYGGGNEKVYDTYAQATADLANISDGQTVFVKEGSNNSLTERVNDLEDDLGDPSSASAVTGADAFSKINTLNTHLSELDIVSGVDGYCTYRKYGKVVTLVINGITNITPQGVVISHLPNGLHPSYQHKISITVAISGVFSVRQGLISTAGEVIIYGANESNVSLWDSVTYII